MNRVADAQIGLSAALVPEPLSKKQKRCHHYGRRRRHAYDGGYGGRAAAKTAFLDRSREIRQKPPARVMMRRLLRSPRASFAKACAVLISAVAEISF
jgi:hypothetical protein